MFRSMQAVEHKARPATRIPKPWMHIKRGCYQYSYYHSSLLSSAAVIILPVVIAIVLLISACKRPPIAPATDGPPRWQPPETPSRDPSRCMSKDFCDCLCFTWRIRTRSQDLEPAQESRTVALPAAAAFLWPQCSSPSLDKRAS